MSQQSEGEAFVSFDFESSFPHKFWISSWGRDESYPEGFRYKVLSAREVPADVIEFVLVLEQPGGLKTEMSRLEVSPGAFDRVAETFVQDLSESYGLDFQLVDLSEVRTSEQFEEAVAAAGWREWTP